MGLDIIQRLLSNPWAILCVVLFFGASIFIHELGHYLAARWRKLKIERFSIGFGPRLFGWTDKQGVDWRVSLLPLGGYVALPQMADMRGVEGDSQYQESTLPPISYSDKMYVAGAGALFNVLFALAIGTVLWITGLPVNEQMRTTTIGYVAESMVDRSGFQQPGVAAVAGLQPGDKLLAIDGRRMRNWEDVVYAITTGTGRSPNGNPMAEITFQRAGNSETVSVFPLLDPDERIRRIGIAPAVSLIVGETMANSPAQRVGLQPGDRIVAVNGVAVFHTTALTEVVLQDPDAAIELSVQRADDTFQTLVRAEKVVVNTLGETAPMLGIRWQPVTEIAHIHPFKQVTDSMRVTFRVLVALFHPRSDIGVSNLSGPVGISYTLYVISQISILDVLAIVLLININLAILNLLPIPVLDGGHMAMATFAKLRGKPISPNWIASIQGSFMLFFLGLVIYVSFFDVGRVGRNERQMIAAEQEAARRVPLQFSGDSEQPYPRNP